MTVWAIIAAGGNGSRFGSDKLLSLLGDRPVLAHSVATLQAHPMIMGLVLVSRSDCRVAYEAAIGTKSYVWAEAGATRRDSVWNGLCVLPETCDTVLIHDAARPLLHPEDLHRLLTEWTPSAVSLAMPMADTIKRVNADGEVQETIDRNELWCVQTPQIFTLAVLRQAHQTVPADMPITDDLQLIEQCPNLPRPTLIAARYPNLKITTVADLQLAKALQLSVL